METIFLFLLKASAGMALFYLVYWLFLRKETFYSANRWFLLAALLSAILIPLFPVHYNVLVEPNENSAALKTIADTFKNIPVVQAEEFENGISWQQVLFIIYLTGASIFLLRLLTQTVILIRLMIKYRIKSLEGVNIVENEKYGLPFSFFNVIFINPMFHTQENLPEILAHEKVHIRENHWFDLLFIELLTVIFWFNPFIWLFERAIKQNHEYLADKGVLAQGHTVGRYQALLVNQLMGMQIIGITNNLNFALNTNRLKMMTKKKTPVIRRMKLVWALPAIALLLFAFAEPNYRYANQNQQPANKETLIQSPAAKTIKIKGVVTDESGELLPGVSIVVKGGTKGTVSDMDGTFSLEIPENADIVLSFVSKKTIIDTYAEIISASQNNGVYAKKYTMKEFITMISNNSYEGDYRTTYDGELLAPPPPPPPPPAANKEKKESLVSGADGVSAPPPPPKGKGEEEIFYVVEDMPHFPGGFYAMQDYFSKMQQKIAQSKGIKGKAKVLFTVNTKGKATDIKVVEQDNDDAAKGAVMLVSSMPEWTPGKQRGKAVSVKYLLPVEFK